MSWEKRVVVYRLCSSYVLFVFLLAKSYGTELVSIGVILDSSNEVGNISRSYMEMARSDFYKAHPNYNTRLGFHFRDPKNDVVDAATAALDLIKNEEVEAIIGPIWSTQAKFVIELGRKAQVPIISFSATSPSLSPTQNPYFVRTAYDDSSQVKAIATIFQAFGWREVSIIYEDTEYGNGLISYLTESFQDVEIRIPYRSAITPSSPTLQVDILTTLNELLRMQTRVFLVHMTGPLGYHFFTEANKAQMLNENTAWIVTDGLSSLVDPVIGKAAFAMEGVVGVRPCLCKASKLAFDKRMEANPNLKGTMKLNLFGLLAYDTVNALATAVESAWKSDQFEPKRQSLVAPNSLKFTISAPSKIGNKIRQGMRNLRISHGLIGDFHLVKGQLQTSSFDVFNVVENEEQVIGYWTSKYGLSKDVLVTGREYSTSKEDLMAPTWPGKTRNIPKGWVIPVNGQKQFKIGVPLTTEFQEFFKIEWDPYTDEPKYSGFAYDVFLAVLENLPFYLPYKFVPFIKESRLSNGTYSDMLKQISQKTVDAVVADTTITFKRSQYVDFTLPYSESGVRMLVAVKDNNKDDMWIFISPLSTNLWLTTALAFICNGFVVWFLERHNNEDFEGSWRRKLELSIWFSFSTLVFAQRERVVSNWTRLVVIVWVFMVLIITQSYAANLASLLTVKQLTPKYTNVQDILSNGLSVGYQKTAFVKDEILVKQLRFPDDSILIPYESVEEYHEGLSNERVAAIFDEIPYIRLFLAKYCDKFMMVGPTYKSDGFGFAFPRNSPLVPYISRAILAVTENKTRMDDIENKNNFSQSLCKEQSENDGATNINKNNASLSLYSFLGLFIIVGGVALFSLCGDLIDISRHVFLSKVKGWYGRFSTFCMFKILEKWRDRLAATRNRRVIPVNNMELSPSRDRLDPNTLSSNQLL